MNLTQKKLNELSIRELNEYSVLYARNFLIKNIIGKPIIVGVMRK